MTRRYKEHRGVSSLLLSNVVCNNVVNYLQEPELLGLAVDVSLCFFIIIIIIINVISCFLIGIFNHLYLINLLGLSLSACYLFSVCPIVFPHPNPISSPFLDQLNFCDFILFPFLAIQL